MEEIISELCQKLFFPTVVGSQLCLPLSSAAGVRTPSFLVLAVAPAACGPRRHVGQEGLVGVFKSWWRWWGHPTVSSLQRPPTPYAQVTPSFIPADSGVGSFITTNWALQPGCLFPFFAVFQLLSIFLVTESKTLLSHQKKRERKEKKKANLVPF